MARPSSARPPGHVRARSLTGRCASCLVVLEYIVFRAQCDGDTPTMHLGQTLQLKAIAEPHPVDPLDEIRAWRWR